MAADRDVPVLALDVAEACEALGISWKSWHEHVAHEVRIVRVGRRKLIAVAELERWLDENAERTLPDSCVRGYAPRPAAGPPSPPGIAEVRGTGGAETRRRRGGR